jgi:hypothetical protein
VRQRRGGTRHQHPDHAHEPEDGHHHPAAERMRIRRRPTVPTTLKSLLGVLAIVGIALATVGQDARWRRTAEAEVEIISLDLQSAPHPAISAGRLVRYQFRVGAAVYDGVALRSWSITTVREAKVCFEAAHPENQGLVKRSESCP